MTGYVNNLTDKEQARHLTGLHRLRRQLCCVDSANCDFCSPVAFGARWFDTPLMQRPGQCLDRFLARFSKEAIIKLMIRQPLFSKLLCRQASQPGLEVGFTFLLLGLFEGFSQVDPRQKVDFNRVSLSPV